MKKLKRHPFPVVAHFERVVAVSFAFPAETLRRMLPSGLELDEFEGYGFLTAALVWTRALRPAGFPEIFGRDFFLSGYRIFTRLKDEDGRRLRGLQILRSETDKQGMVFAGNLMTSYNYRRVNVNIREDGGSTVVRTSLPNGAETLGLRFRPASEDDGLPEGSPFKDWREARRFAGPMPFTFSEQGDGSFVVIEGSRQSWKPAPVTVEKWDVSLFDESRLAGVKPILANAFEVRNVDYRWSKGRIVRLGGGE